MYYKIYGVMSTSGFHTELANANTEGKALAALASINEDQYPFFAITEHLRSGSPALAILPGVTKDRAPSAKHGLVEFKPNPMENFQLAEKLFTALASRQAFGAMTDGKLHPAALSAIENENQTASEAKL